jgi:hypothetical protein
MLLPLKGCHFNYNLNVIDLSHIIRLPCGVSSAVDHCMDSAETHNNEPVRNSLMLFACREASGPYCSVYVVLY